MAGIVTGLIPGVHVNLVSIILLSISPALLNYTTPIVLACFIISLSITHSFLDTIPSIFLGAPEADTAMAVLPGHLLLLQGLGYEAVKLTVIGSLLCLLLGLLLVPLFIFAVPRIYLFLQPFIGWILTFIVIFLILREKGLNKKFWSFFIVLVSGVLGIIVLNAENIQQPLFPMLSGIFGVSMLAVSLQQKVVLPKQRVTEMIHLEKGETAKALVAGTLSGGLVSIFPGLGAAQAAVLSSVFFKDIAAYSYLVLVGGINTVNFLLSLVTFYTLEKARNGAVIVVLEILHNINLNTLLIFLTAALITGGVATILALNLTRVFSAIISKVPYHWLCIGVILFIITLVFYFSGFIGLLVLIISTSIGLIPPIVGIGKNHGMGCLLIPVILFFLL